MKKALSKIIESGILASISLGLAYLLSYHYQSSFLSFYGLPQTYVDLSLTKVIEIFTYVLSFFYLLYMVIRLISMLVPKLKTFVAIQILYFSLVYIVVSLLTLVLLDKPLKWVIGITIGYVIYISYRLITPAVRINGKKSYSEKWQQFSAKLESDHNKEGEWRKDSVFYPFDRTLVSVGLCIATVYTLCNIFRVAGLNNAQQTEEYLIAKNYNDKIVVYQTQDYYILMEENDGVLKNEFQIVSADEIGTLKKEKTGVLKLENE